MCLPREEILLVNSNDMQLCKFSSFSLAQLQFSSTSNNSVYILPDGAKNVPPSFTNCNKKTKKQSYSNKVF